MSTFRTLVRLPDERMSDYNYRLQVACRESPVTDFEASVVDGLPVVTLISSLVEPDEEMIDEAEKAGQPLKDGELVPESDPVILQVCELGAIKAISGDCEQRMEALNKRAKGEAASVEHVVGPQVQWISDANDLTPQGTPKNATMTPKQVLIQTQVVFAIVTYFYDPSDPMPKPPEPRK